MLSPCLFDLYLFCFLMFDTRVFLMKGERFLIHQENISEKIECQKHLSAVSLLFPISNDFSLVLPFYALIFNYKITSSYRKVVKKLPKKLSYFLQPYSKINILPNCSLILSLSLSSSFPILCIHVNNMRI